MENMVNKIFRSLEYRSLQAAYDQILNPSSRSPPRPTPIPKPVLIFWDADGCKPPPTILNEAFVNLIRTTASKYGTVRKISVYPGKVVARYPEYTALRHALGETSDVEMVDTQASRKRWDVLGLMCKNILECNLELFAPPCTLFILTKGDAASLNLLGTLFHMHATGYTIILATRTRTLLPGLARLLTQHLDWQDLVDRVSYSHNPGLYHDPQPSDSSASIISASKPKPKPKPRTTSSPPPNGRLRKDKTPAPPLSAFTPLTTYLQTQLTRTGANYHTLHGIDAFQIAHALAPTLAQRKIIYQAAGVSKLRKYLNLAEKAGLVQSHYNAPKKRGSRASHRMVALRGRYVPH
ncbi:hypothetical protein FA15DRAFT_760160 [Coprinopsis marcescibilis]|uniref:NYN domain-containing protein n=1 Tax=Coprinopsis marcescibilis TaxID=230819 RepID=A0A5C3KGN7_COPMA|nr:hypothetical protein FA15DRAFT_760160 [Coprinopsis marcescibilis]